MAATVGLSIFLFSACNDTPKDTIPEYGEDKTFLIGAWSDPPKNLSNYKTAKEMGWITCSFPAAWARTSISTAWNISKKSD